MKTRDSKLNKNNMGGLKSLAVMIATFFSLSAGATMINGEVTASAAMGAFSNYLNIETEDAIHIEDWMLEKSRFINELSIETEAEAPVAIEPWMTGSIFNAFAALSADADNAIGIESWMLQDTLFQALAKAEPAVTEKAAEKTVKTKKVIGVTFEGVQFGQRSFIIIEEDDPKPTLERWMFDYSHFKK